ncbi:MAG TPA: hypothetical protein VH482_20950 [Thermomicrobiales bacterium]
MAEQFDVAEALAGAFGLAAPRVVAAHGSERRQFEAPTGRRNWLVARAGGLSLRHTDGWTLVVDSDRRGRPTRAEVTGRYPPPEAIARLRRADERSGGVLGTALGKGRSRHTRFVLRALKG